MCDFSLAYGASIMMHVILDCGFDAACGEMQVLKCDIGHACGDMYESLSVRLAPCAVLPSYVSCLVCDFGPA